MLNNNNVAEPEPMYPLEPKVTANFVKKRCSYKRAVITNSNLTCSTELGYQLLAHNIQKIYEPLRRCLFGTALFGIWVALRPKCLLHPQQYQAYVR
jgi:hypothetical protein